MRWSNKCLLSVDVSALSVAQEFRGLFLPHYLPFIQNLELAMDTNGGRWNIYEVVYVK